MSVLIFAESNNGKINKATLEVASYAKEIANSLNTTLTAVAINANDTSEISQYGVDKLLSVTNSNLDNFNAKAYADVIKQAAEKEGSNLVVMTSSTNGKYLSPLVASNLNAGYASNVIALPESTSPFKVKRTAFSNKASIGYRSALRVRWPPLTCKAKLSNATTPATSIKPTLISIHLLCITRLQTLALLK